MELPFYSFGIGVVFTERFIIYVLALIGVYGIFDLFSFLNELNGKCRFDQLLPITVSSLFFIMNPYTLSVIWAHIQAWTFFYVYIPFLLSFLLRFHYTDSLNLRRLSWTSILGIFLSDGLSQAYAPAFLYAVLFFLLAEFVIFTHRNERTSKSLCTKLPLRIALLLLFAFTVIGWNIVPSLGVATRFGLGKPTSYSLSFLQSESRTTSLLHVLKMLGYSWIYNAPNVYPWIGNYNLISYGASLSLGLIGFCPLLIPRYKSLGILYLFMLPVIGFMTGSNPPFGEINEILLSLGGPFLALISAYYLIGELYPVFISVLLFFTLTYILDTLRSLRVAVLDSNARQSVKRVYPKPSKCSWSYLTSRIFKQRSVLIGSSLAVIVFIMFLLSLMWMPFALGRVYQTSGENITEFSIPSDFFSLRNFLLQNYSGPYYYSLLLPLSAIGATFYAYNQHNSTFPDTSGFLSYFDPYPLIFKNASTVYGYPALMNYLYSSSDEHIGIVLTALHIRYVIVETNYVENYFMTHSFNAARFELSRVTANLNHSIGFPTIIGKFYVYENVAATPFVSFQNGISILLVPNFESYLQFLSKLNSSSGSLSSSIVHSFWSNQSIPGIPKISPQAYTNLDQQIQFIHGSNIFFLNSNGSFQSRLTGATVRNDTLYLNGTMVARMGDSATFNTSMIQLNGTLVSKVGGENSIRFLPSFPSGVQVSMKFTYNPVINGQRMYFYFTSDDVNLSVQIVYQASKFDIQSTAVSLKSGQLYAWNDTVVPSASLSGHTSLTIFLNDSVLTTKLVYNNAEVTIGKLFFGPNDYYQSAGTNSSAAPRTISIDSEYSAYFKVLGNFTTNGFGIYQKLPISYVVMTCGNLSGISYAQPNLRVQNNGNYIIEQPGYIPNGHYYLVESIPTEYSLGGWSTSISPIAKYSPNPFTVVFQFLITGNVSNLVIKLQLKNDVTPWLWFSVAEVIIFSAVILILVFPLTRELFRHRH